jgi:hypothetical protein
VAKGEQAGVAKQQVVRESQSSIEECNSESLLETGASEQINWEQWNRN